MFTRIGLLGAGTVWENSYLGRATPLHTSERERERDIFTWDSDCGPLCVPPPPPGRCPSTINQLRSLSLSPEYRQAAATDCHQRGLDCNYFLLRPTAPVVHRNTSLIWELFHSSSFEKSQSSGTSCVKHTAVRTSTINQIVSSANSSTWSQHCPAIISGLILTASKVTVSVEFKLVNLRLEVVRESQCTVFLFYWNNNFDKFNINISTSLFSVGSREFF